MTLSRLRMVGWEDSEHGGAEGEDLALAHFTLSPPKVASVAVDADAAAAGAGAGAGAAADGAVDISISWRNSDVSLMRSNL